MAEILGPAPEALSNTEIMKKFGESLRELTKAAWDSQYDFERQIAIQQARYQWLLIKNNQTSIFGWNQNNDYADGTGNANWVPFDYGTSAQEETGAEVRICPPVNFLGGDGYKFMAVMGSSSPRVKAVADDLRDPDEVASAKCADINIRDLWLKNKIDRKWKIPAFHLYATGPCFIRTYWNTDAIKYGSTTEPQIDIVLNEFGLPVPKVTGEQSYANGDAEVSFHSILDVSVPWEAKELAGNFLRLERMVSKWALLAKYPGKPATDTRPAEPGPLDQFRDSTVPDDSMSASDVTASEAQQAVANPSGTAKSRKPNEWRFTEWWIPPYLFEAVTNPEARQVFQNQFSRGMYLARVGSKDVELDEREVTQEWAVCTVNRGEKIMERPICADNVPIQRGINDLFAMAMETVLRAITMTIADNQLFDRQAMSTREAVPAELILTALPVDGDLNKRIYQIPPAHLSDQVIPLLNQMRAFGQDISGVRPELSGGGAPTQTYREAKQRKDQALQQLAPQAQSMRDAAEDVAKNLVVLRSRYGTGTVKASQKTAYGVETDVCEMADLAESGWHTESDDNFPLTLADKRDAIFSLLKDGLPDAVINILGVTDILNAPELAELMGVEGFHSSVVEQIQKTLRDVDRLLAGAPIIGMPSAPGAPPAPPKPSIPPDPFDDAALVAQFMAKWLRSPAGQKHAGTPGFQNVVASWSAYNAMATPPTPPPPPPIKGSLALSAKMEDFPGLLPEVMQGAGLKPPPPPPAPPPGLPSPSNVHGIPPAAKPNGAPSPMMAAPIPPLPNGVASPPPTQ